jgi:DNA-binding transcriptional ArsR family regulator
VAHAFYPFVENETSQAPQPGGHQNADASPLLAEVSNPARIAVYDDPAAAPRVVVIEPSDVRSYLEEITSEVVRLSYEQGGTIPFMVIREVVENLIHAYFIEPIISILPGGNTIRFADQGPGIKDKSRALEYGTTTATREMKRYIRGVGSGLPYVQQYLLDKGGSLLIEDNMDRGTIVTITMGTPVRREDLSPTVAPAMAAVATPMVGTSPATQAAPTNQQADPFDDVSERGKKILDYLRNHEMVGPKDLTEAYGFSPATWSRELKALDDEGLLVKQRDGQKRYLTPAARRLLGLA